MVISIKKKNSFKLKKNMKKTRKKTRKHMKGGSFKNYGNFNSSSLKRKPENGPNKLSVKKVRLNPKEHIYATLNTEEQPYSYLPVKSLPLPKIIEPQKQQFDLSQLQNFKNQLEANNKIILEKMRENRLNRMKILALKKLGLSDNVKLENLTNNQRISYNTNYNKLIEQINKQRETHPRPITNMQRLGAKVIASTQKKGNRFLQAVLNASEKENPYVLPTNPNVPRRNSKPPGLAKIIANAKEASRKQTLASKESLASQTAIELINNENAARIAADAENQASRNSIFQQI